MKRREVVKWIPPVVMGCTLPAHAQTSGPVIPPPPTCEETISNAQQAWQEARNNPDLSDDEKEEIRQAFIDSKECRE